MTIVHAVPFSQDPGVEENPCGSSEDSASQNSRSDGHTQTPPPVLNDENTPLPHVDLNSLVNLKEALSATPNTTNHEKISAEQRFSPFFYCRGL